MLRRYGLVLLCLPVLLSGCAEYRARIQAQNAARQEAINDADDNYCRSLGTAPGSTAYVYCRQATVANRQAADDAQRQAWAGVAQTGFQMMATQPAPPQPDHVCVAQNNTLYRC